MNRYTDPRPGDTIAARRLYRREWKHWVAGQIFELFVTLNFNRDTSVAGARRLISQFLARLDRGFLGRHWSTMAAAERAFAVIVLENLDTNLHAHMALRLPQPAAAMSRDEQRQFLESSWERLVPCGQCDVQAVYGRRARMAGYMAKQLARRGYAETFIISTEFHT